MVQTERQKQQSLWEQRIEDYRKSGMSGQAWCKLHGYKYNDFRYRVGKQNAAKKLAESNHPETSWLALSGAGFVESDGLLVKAGKALIDVRPGFDPDLLRLVVEALSSC